MLQGRSAAASTENSLIASPNKAAEHLAPSRGNPAIFPPVERSETVLPDFSHDARFEREITCYFTRLKAGKCVQWHASKIIEITLTAGPVSR